MQLKRGSGDEIRSWKTTFVIFWENIAFLTSFGSHFARVWSRLKEINC